MEGAAFCSVCGQSTGAADTVRPQAGVPTPPPQPATVRGEASPPVPRTAAFLYAGFWLRAVAAIIDGLILAVPTALVFFALFASALPSLARGGEPRILILTLLPRLLLIALMYLAGSWLYWALMESSEWQATLGKKSLGLYVTDLAGNRATFGRTSGRFFAGRGIGMIPYLGGLYFIVSCIMAGFTEKKQALHDMIANCLVLRKA